MVPFALEPTKVYFPRVWELRALFPIFFVFECTFRLPFRNYHYPPLLNYYSSAEMGRAPCCDKNGLKKGPWTPEEDLLLTNYIQTHGPGNWRNLPKNAGWFLYMSFLLFSQYIIAFPNWSCSFCVLYWLLMNMCVW